MTIFVLVTMILLPNGELNTRIDRYLTSEICMRRGYERLEQAFKDPDIADFRFACLKGEFDLNRKGVPS